MNEFVFSTKPIEIARGEGVYLVDTAGTRYLDAGASYGCVPVGHGHERVLDAIAGQAEDLLFVQGSYPTAARSTLVDRLGDVAPPGIESVWLCNSGSEANEAALKFARSATGRPGIVAAKGAFHGRTMGALSATWKPAYRRPYEPLLDDVTFVPYGDVEALLAATDEEVAAVILEPILGEGGVVPAPDGYLAAAREATEAVGAALVFDEVQTGLGRTGTFWASDDAEVTPDILTAAKGLANGLPIGATLCADWIAAGAASHGSTYAGGPAVAAAAAATIDVIIEESLVENAATVGRYLKAELSAASHDFGTIRGRGLMLGLERRTGIGDALGSLAMEARILALPAGRTVVRLLPPLTLERAHADRIVAAIADTITPEEVTP